MNRKILLSGFAALSIAVVAVFNLGLVSKSSNLSDVSLANVEALAASANGGLADEINWLCPNGCYLNGSGCYCYGWYKDEREAGNNF
jgi:hypothetical protein